MKVVKGHGNLALSPCKVELMRQQYRVVEISRDSDIDGATAHEYVREHGNLTLSPCRPLQ